MAEYRFRVGTTVLCNLGDHGWKLGRVITLNYREDHWPEGEVVPYQVALEGDYSLIYVPVDNDHYCRETTDEDLKIIHRKDALAALHPQQENDRQSSKHSDGDSNLCCSTDLSTPQYQGYRKGRCFCCDDCPKNWSYAELYSEHYRCAERNNVKITRHEIDLGLVVVGDVLDQKPDGFLLDKKGIYASPYAC